MHPPQVTETDPADHVLARVERSYDAIPRSGARAERIGPFVLFVREGAGHPWYARPALGASGITADDVAALRARQRELGVPESLEWVAETTPELLDAARSAGLAVHRAPLMVLSGSVGPAPLARGTRLRVVDPAAASFAADLAAGRAVADLAFRTGGTAVGAAGPTERDALAAIPVPDEVAETGRLLHRGIRVQVLADNASGTVATGTLVRPAPESAAGGAEVVGVATLPSARRRGLGLAVTAELAQLALAAGAGPVFLSAENDDVARLYSRLGFGRVGTACVAEPATT